MPPKMKIPSTEDLEKLAAAEAEAPPAADGAPAAAEPEAPPPLNVDAFVDELSAAQTEGAISDIVRANAAALDAFREASPSVAETLKGTIEANVERVRALSQAHTFGPVVRLPKIVKVGCYPTIFGQRVDCPAGTLVHWTQAQIDEAQRQGVLLVDP